MAMGLASPRLLEAKDLPDLALHYVWPSLLSLGAMVSISFFATLAAFLLGLALQVQIGLVLLTLGLIVVVLAASRNLGKPAVKTAPEPTGRYPTLGDIIGGAIAGDPCLGLIVAFSAVLIAFLLFVIWLPVLLLVLNGISLGELWRGYHVAVVTTERDARLTETGHDLLARGGILSRSWDPYLDPHDQTLAHSGRSVHYRMHWSLVVMGIATLAVAAGEILSRTFPTILWSFVILAGVGVTLVSFLLVLDAARRRRASRIQRSVNE